MSKTKERLLMHDTRGEYANDDYIDDEYWYNQYTKKIKKESLKFELLD